MDRLHLSGAPSENIDDILTVFTNFATQTGAPGSGPYQNADHHYIRSIMQTSTYEK